MNGGISRPPAVERFTQEFAPRIGPKKNGAVFVLSTYLSYELITRDMGKSLDRIEQQPMVERETQYYLENIGKVKSVDDFISNDRLFKYAMKAYGLGDMDYAKAFMKKVLDEGISDSGSFANKLTDKRYYEFAKVFNFEKYGDLTTSFNAAQDNVPGNFAAQVAIAGAQPGYSFAQTETEYYLQTISSVKSIDDLMGNERLLDYAMSAFGLDADTEDPARVRTMLEGGVSDPASPANKLGDKRYANFVTAFDFAQFGEATTSSGAVRQGVPAGYMATSGLDMVLPRDGYVADETAYYLANIGDVKSIDDLMGDKRLLTVAMAAYGLDASTEDPATIRLMLQGGVASQTSPANLKSDKRYADFVTAFDFAQYGDQTTTRDAVTKTAPEQYGTMASLGLVGVNSDYLSAETSYYVAHVSDLHSIDDLMGDKRLLDFALTSYGLDPATETPEHVRALLEGGVDDPESLANTATNKGYAGFVSAFNFVRYGDEATTVNAAQETTVDNYLRQTLEETEGDKNEGVRLALYFQRKAPELTSYYQILGDTALSQVVRTGLNLPDAMSQADIDKQVEVLKDKFDLADFKDPEKLQDFLQRFTTMWEIDNPSDTSAQNSIAALFQPAEYGISTDLLLTISQMRT